MTEKNFNIKCKTKRNTMICGDTNQIIKINNHKKICEINLILNNELSRGCNLEYFILDEPLFIDLESNDKIIVILPKEENIISECKNNTRKDKYSNNIIIKLVSGCTYHMENTILNSRQKEKELELRAINIELDLKTDSKEHILKTKIKELDKKTEDLKPENFEDFRLNKIKEIDSSISVFEILTLITFSIIILIIGKYMIKNRHNFFCKKEMDVMKELEDIEMSVKKTKSMLQEATTSDVDNL
jgi:hypothetical protein